MRKTLTHEEAVKWFRYDLRTGAITWRRTPPHAPHCEGLPAGGWDFNGRRVIRLHGQQYQATRMAYLLYYGRWPSGRLYLKNGIPSDTRISNLKERY